MLNTFRSTSFAYGVLAAVLLACVIGAAGNNGDRSPKYDAAPAMGGLGLQIINHDTNSLYNYRRDKDGDAVVYKLVEKIDLSMAGNAEIPAELSDR